jgi:hypothetical protein
MSNSNVGTLCLRSMQCLKFNLTLTQALFLIVIVKVYFVSITEVF